MKLMIMLLISLLLATGVEAGKKKCTKCTKKFEAAERKFNQCKEKNCPSPSPPLAPPSPPLAPPSKQPGTFTSKGSLKKAVKAFNNKPAKAEEKYGPIAGWDVSGITDMSYLFSVGPTRFPVFNADISNWNTSGVTNMNGMFANAAAFNQPVGFDTSRVTDMDAMFTSATAFNQPLSLDTSSVTTMGSMFYRATAFNQPLNLDTSSVTFMRSMFDATDSLSAANKLLIRCAWAGTDVFASAGYGENWAPGSC